MTAAASGVPEPCGFVRRLPVGERLPMPADPVTEWETFPFEAFEGKLRVRPLLPPVLPEPGRTGRRGPRSAWSAASP